MNKKILNWSSPGKVLAAVGLWFGWRHWFVMVIVPAIPGQKRCFGVMAGTHGRHGLLLWNRWVFNGQSATVNEVSEKIFAGGAR